MGLGGARNRHFHRLRSAATRNSGRNAERDKVQALHIAIGDAYFTKTMPVIDEQLATAGFRLAVLLNATL